eukprot:scaffold37723_cov189-Skeletonema_marinoi.AAC.10
MMLSLEILSHSMITLPQTLLLATILLVLVILVVAWLMLLLGQLFDFCANAADGEGRSPRGKGSKERITSLSALI